MHQFDSTFHHFVPLCPISSIFPFFRFVLIINHFLPIFTNVQKTSPMFTNLKWFLLIVHVFHSVYLVLLIFLDCLAKYNFFLEFARKNAYLCIIAWISLILPNFSLFFLMLLDFTQFCSIFLDLNIFQEFMHFFPILPHCHILSSLAPFCKILPDFDPFFLFWRCMPNFLIFS